MLYINDGVAARRTPAELHALEDAVWLDLVSPTDAERSAVERVTGLRVPSLDDLSEIETSSRIYAENEVLYFSIPYTARHGDHHAFTTAVGFVLSERHFLTVRYADLPAFDTFAERFAHAGAVPPGAVPPGAVPPAPVLPAAVLTGLVEGIVDALADLLERLAAELDRLSKATFSTNIDGRQDARADRTLRATLGSIGRCGDTLGNMRDSVVTFARIVAYLQQNPVAWLPQQLTPRIATLHQDIASLNDYSQQLMAKVHFLLDAVLGFINIEQNNGVKVLTVVSVVGIPPTFVVGLYGMNFKNMPEYDWQYGYAYGWAMILLSIAVPLIFFRIKRWI